MTYRAAYLAPAQSAGVVMTTQDQAHLSDADLAEAAVIEGHNAGIIGDTDDEDGLVVTEATFRDLLVIGDWHD